MLSQKARDRILALKGRYPHPRSATLPSLYVAQDDQRWLSTEVIDEVAALLEMPARMLHEVATFYVMFETKPVGTHLVEVCDNISCALRGADALLAHLEKKWGIRRGETTADGRFSLRGAECLGACGTAPCVMIDHKYWENLTPAEMDRRLAELDDDPHHTKGDLALKPLSNPAADPGRGTAVDAGGKSFPLILTKNMHKENSHLLSTYVAGGGYGSWQKALKTMTPEQIVQTVKDSGLRGRGGAGFPAGLKWSFVPARSEKPKYLACNCDESEPGTFKDRVIITHDPHMLLEGMAIASFAIGSHLAFIYIRGEYAQEAVILERAIDEARAAGHLGKNIYGTGYELDMIVYRGAGAYIAGEETGMLESLEGKRAHPRVKPPFPAVVGLYGCPTLINNVETLANVPAIIENGGAWFAAIGTPKATGTKLMNISGHVNRPGVIELPMGTPLMEIIDKHCGGVWKGRKLKGCIPGGSSVPVLTAEECAKVNMDFDSLGAAGTMLGTAAMIVMDDTTSMPNVARRLTRFYDEESCGQCTPCREGTAWAHTILKRFVEEGGEPHEIDLLLDICDNMGGRTICALADAAVGPIKSTIEKFRSEYEAAVKSGLREKDTVCVESGGGAS